MPKANKLPVTELFESLKRALLLGPQSSTELCSKLGISQASFSRLISNKKDQLFVYGSFKHTRYGLLRAIPDVGTSIPVHRIDKSGKATLEGEIFFLHPKVYLWSPTQGAFDQFDDFPYFLDDLRPSGFLGRLIPKQHPELQLPEDIQRWSSDQCLRYLVRYGWNLAGNLIVGEGAFETFLKKALEPVSPLIPVENRVGEYPRIAESALKYGDAGSSAAGEQPKFLAWVDIGRKSHAVPVITKFSPAGDNEVAVRRADLLVAEFIALETLSEAGKSVSKAELVIGPDRVFLQMERFDRTPQGGRKGLISLRALDLEFVGKGTSWVDIAEDLLRQRMINREIFEEIKFFELFGDLIANSDKHPGNLSFFFENGRIVGLAPIYDMLPMLYAPRNEQIVERKMEIPIPSISEAAAWKKARKLSIIFWDKVSSNKDVSAGFKKIALGNLEMLKDAAKLERLLPD